MKNSKIEVEKYIKPGARVVKQVMISSESVPGDYHLIKVYDDGKISCNCIRFSLYHMDCSHINRVRHMLLNNEV